MHYRAYSVIVLLCAGILAAPSARGQTTPAFIGWPSAITNYYTNVQVAYTNGPSVPGNPNMVFTPPAPSIYGLPATNVSGPVTVSVASPTNGFGVVANAGQPTNINNTNFILLYWTNGTSAPSGPYTNTIQVTLNNEPNSTSATTNIAIVTLPQVPFTSYLGITFTNDNYAADPNLTNVWLSFVTNSSISNTIGFVSNSTTNITWSSTNLMSDPVSLATVNSNGGLAFTSGSSVIGYLSYGAPLGSLSNSPSPVATNDASYGIPWVQFELTRGGTAQGPVVGDVGDLTFINEFSAPLFIKSYDTNGNLLQYSGFFTNSTQTIFEALAALTQTNTNAVITNSAGQFVRVVAPVSFSDLVGPYDIFHTYITNLAAGTNKAYLQNFSAFPVQGNAQTNIIFTFTMTNNYNTDGTMAIDGIVTASNTVSPYTPAATFSNLTILYATNANSTITNIGGAIYGANYTTASNTILFVDTTNSSTFANWTAMSNWMVGQYGTNPNPGPAGSDVYSTVLAQMVGEVSATLESGLAGSTNSVTNGMVSGVLGTNLSQNWWTMTNPLVIMRNAQTNPFNYDQYGDVIYFYSSNSVYNFSYNDRFNNAKPVVFVNRVNGTNVGSWVIGVGAPVSTVGTNPPPPSFLSYNTWLTLWPSLTNTAQSADPDNDSFNNATEYAFDGNPTVGSPAMLAAAGAGTNSVFRFAGLQGASTNYTVQGTTNLATGPWTNSSVTVSKAADQSGLLLSNSYERREFTVPAAGSNAFFRVLFTNAP